MSAYDEYRKLFYEEHVPLVTKINATHHAGLPPDPDDNKRLDDLMDRMDKLFYKLTPREHVLMEWWGIRANAKDFVAHLEQTKEKYLGKNMSPEALEKEFHDLLEHCGWMVAVLNCEYLNRDAPPENWTPARRCDCKKKEGK